jgi:hypothetical protein
VGSRLLVVIDTPSQRTDSRRRFRIAVRWVAWLVLAGITCSWLFLYLDSVHQRRRAEALFADLKSLDFAAAGFPEVRDIMVRNGGRPVATCNPQNCTFLLQIMTRLPRIPLLDRKARFFYTVLPYIGVRSWGVGAILEVRNGKLERSQTEVSEIRMERTDSSGYRHLVPLGYAVDTRRDAEGFEDRACGNQDYRVYVSHGYFKFPANILTTCVVQSAGVPTRRAFDVHLGCLNGLFRSCRFDELAPSAWADIPR